MTLLHALVHTPFAGALGWTIFHSLWEGAVAALVLAVALSVIRSSRVRYCAACIALLAIVAAFAVTLWRAIPVGPEAHATVVLAFGPGGSRGTGLPDMFAEWRLAMLLPWLTPFWLAGMVSFHVRSVAGWAMARRLDRSGTCAAPETWQRRIELLRARVAITKPVRLLETALTQTPVVVGWLRPAVVIPIGMLTGMPASQIEAILIHELAHIRRRDYLANLLQMVVEGFLFYHPAVWWISHVIRAERENCCDDFVVALNGNAHEYATALVALEENRRVPNQAALAATGGSLMKRVRRLLFPKQSSRNFLTPALSAGILVLVAAFASMAWQTKPASAFDRWLDEDVPYIITDQERAGYQAMSTDEERNRFIELFWAIRNPTPGSIENPYKVEHYRRIAFANAHFDERLDSRGWKTDRGRIYITFGPPDEIDSHPNGSATAPPYEEWLYRYIEGIGSNVKMDFEDTQRNGEYHMAKDPNPDQGRLVTNPNQQ